MEEYVTRKEFEELKEIVMSLQKELLNVKKHEGLTPDGIEKMFKQLTPSKELIKYHA